MPNSSVSDKKLKHYPNGLACNTVHGYRLRLNFKCKAPALFQFFIENMHVMLKNAQVKLISSIPEHKCLSSRQSQLKQHELEKNKHMSKFIRSYKCFHRILLHYPLF